MHSIMYNNRAGKVLMGGMQEKVRRSRKSVCRTLARLFFFLSS